MARRAHGREARTGAIWWIARVSAWTVILAAAGALVVSVLVPRVAGATPYTILTGSMRPELPPGTLVVVRPTPADEIGVGDVITYQLMSGEPTVVTHRVSAVRQSPDGTRAFATRGDANSVDDAALVRPVQVKGRLWYSVPRLGYVSKYVTDRDRAAVTMVAAGVLLLFAGRMFAEAFADRRRAQVRA